MMTGSLKKKKKIKKKKKGACSDIRACSLIRSNTVFGTHHVHRITHECLIMTYFQCGPFDDVWGFRVGGGVHDSYTFQCGLV